MASNKTMACTTTPLVQSKILFSSTPSLEANKKRKIQVSNVLKEACAKYHPSHVAKLHPEVNSFTRLVQKKDGFCENEVYTFGDIDVKKDPVGALPKRLMANMALVDEGIPYCVDGITKIFDSAQHLFEFLRNGIPGQVDMWARGGVMSCYVHVFGEDKGNRMKESSWKDFVGIIPYMLVQPHQENIRMTLGLELRTDVKSTGLGLGVPPNASHFYHLWRPVLLAKFTIPRLRKLLVETGSLYLLDKEDIDKVKQDSETGCVVYPKPKKHASEEEKAEYERKRSAKCRIHGSLVGKNRMGRFLMAIRSELKMIEIVNTKPSSEVCSKKRKAS